MGGLNVAPGPREQVSELALHHMPELYAALFARDGGERRALEWFDHFGTDGVEAFRYGAKALAKFALNNRDQVSASAPRHQAPFVRTPFLFRPSVSPAWTPRTLHAWMTVMDVITGTGAA